MLNLHLGHGLSSPFRILCLGAHSDDIEIGCGGTILRLLGSAKNCDVTWVVFSAKGQRRHEAHASAMRFLKSAWRKTIITKGFKENVFPYQGEKIRQVFTQLQDTVVPNLILTHYRNDLHQDHRLINEFTWNTFRHHHILEYEIPKYDGDLGTPNVYMPLTKSICDQKVRYLMDGFLTQRKKQWFSEDTFYALLRLRGVESRASDNYAEAFYGRKLILS